ncbi:3-methyl-2-oxobutanoate hydroxymethyltransferase [Deinococcus detaillensis]|uniref:3-methyl-2-oxobutanoate hydroxymethyltransferase n=1 Tax=Deinococcus detaillensis TaxID=2592048 RepID=A0A553V322_9DEIO|nr:3-methyl-2-oxobutanoate hydroxymethyltransferase [Deinococcus detaillensis]TSA86784.1 3-methyl-2-oxobutanoate hydroxymethyltransferase [Deinococcus detaillensis]
MKLTLPELIRDTPLVMVTAYDYPGAQQAERAGMDLILVGDSLGNVVLGYDSTAPVTLSDIIHHARAVRRGAPETFLVADLPFGTYHTSLQDTMRAAIKVIQETGADAIKVEGASPEVLEAITVLSRNGIPVMGHVGLTPQTEVSLGGRKVQGRDEVGAQKIVQAALAVEAAGAFAVVLEVIPARLARLITEKLSIPTIGIGAGPYCKGQVLVYHDVLGVYDNEKKIAKRYAELGQLATEALKQYAADVREKNFPTKENSFIIKDEVLDHLY